MGGRDYGHLYKRHKEITANAMHSVFVNPDITPVEEQIIAEGRLLADIFLSYAGQPFDPKLDLGLAAAGVMFRLLFSDNNCRDDLDCQQLVEYSTDFAANTVGSLIVDFIPQARFLSGAGLKKFYRATATMERLILRKLAENEQSYNPEAMRNMIDALRKATASLDQQERDLGLNESLLLEGTSQEMMGTGLQPMYPLLRWILLYMIAYPEVQAKIQEEIATAIGSDQPIRYEDRHKLPFTEACIYEVLRHAPLFPLTIPHGVTQDTSLNGYFIPKDSIVMVNLFSLTRDPLYWSEPEVFNPQRFLDGSGKIREDLQDKYYPFGLGKRRCFGEYLGRVETFLFLTNLLQRCQLKALPNDNLDFSGVSGTMLHPHTYQITAQPRF
jgi:cytochrome P450